MRTVLGERLAQARNVAAVRGSETSVPAAYGRSFCEWFPRTARALLGKDAGLHLHYITGYPERSCYYYASGQRVPPAHFIRVLFHSPQGEPFFLSFMEDCEAPWWRDMEHARRIAKAVADAR